MQELRALWGWIKEQGIDVSEISVGVCRIVLAPKVPVSGSLPSMTTDDREGIYRQMGGELFKDVAKELGMEGLVPSITVKP